MFIAGFGGYLSLFMLSICSTEGSGHRCDMNFAFFQNSAGDGKASTRLPSRS